VRKLFDLAREGPERPFFLVVSFTHPHDPWEVRPHYWDLYEPEAIDLPAVPAIPFADADPYSRRLREMCGTEEVELSEQQLRTARHGYYAAISYLDERVGEVLGALRDAGLEDDTAVVFCADHGEMLGERGLWYKMSFFEPSVRVPLFVRAPGHSSTRRVAEPVSLLDLAPTLLELAGVPALGDLAEEPEGVSLLGLVADGTGGRPGPVLGEYLAEGVTAPAVMIREGRHKLVACEGDPDQLYDLAEDPAELVNLAAEPGHRPILTALRATLAARWDLGALRTHVMASQRERHLVGRALEQGAYTSWDFEPSVDASTRYVRSRADLYALQRRSRLETQA
jgi:choline-sulfatase